MIDLSILSVSFKNERVLRHIIENTNFGNINYNWINVINHQPTEGKLNCRLIKGVTYNEAILYLRRFCNLRRITFRKTSVPAYHHALGLHKGLIHCKQSRFLLVIDSDFFIFYKIESILNHMISKKLDFFGACYSNIIWEAQYACFPTAFCLFIDLDKIPIRKLNFLPDIEHKPILDTGGRIYQRFKDSCNFEGLNCLEANAHCEEYLFNGKYFGSHYRLMSYFRSTEDYELHKEQAITHIKYLRTESPFKDQDE